MSTAEAGANQVTARQWLILGVATFVAASGSAFITGVGFLLPYFHSTMGMSLTRAGVLVAMPSVGMALTLIAWGWLVDRTGEKLVLVSGSVAAALALIALLFTDSYGAMATFLLIAGAATASGNSASGRLVVGWFPPHRRGLAMGIRQMSQPVGAAIAAMTMPLIAQAHGLGPAFVVPLVMAAISAVAALVVVEDPPVAPAAPAATSAPTSESASAFTSVSSVPTAASTSIPSTPSTPSTPAAVSDSPYRASDYLQRVHGVSVLLVLPQGMLQAFLLAWLVLGHGWSAVSAGIVVTVSQILGAAARIVAGAVSDRVGSRMKPIRGVAISVTAGLAALAAAEALGAPGSIAVTLAVIATVLSVSDNGLAFTAVAEYAGPRWSGRALGVQNTSQFVTISLATPLIAAAIERFDYWPVFAGAALIAAVAIPLVPRADQHR